MLLRLLVATGLAFAALILFLLLLVRSDMGAYRLCDVSTAVLQDVSGHEVVIGKCTVDPIGTRVTIENVRIGPANAPLFMADRLSAGISHRGFLEGKIRIDQVEVVRPRVRLDLSQPAPHDDELRRPAGAACLPDLGRLELGSVSLTDGDLSITLPEGRHADALGMAVTMQGDGEKLKVEFHTKETTYSDAAGRTTADRTVVRGQFDLNAGTAQLDAVDVSAPEGSFFATAELSSICRLQGSASATIHADLGRLHQHLLRSVDNLAGTATIRPQITFDGFSFEATVHADVENSTVLQFTPGSFTADFHATPDILEVTRFDLPIATGKVTATGKLLLAPPYQLNVDARLENLSLGELVQRIGQPDLPVEVRSTGRAQLSGVVAGPHGLALELALDVGVAEFGVYDRSFKRRHERDVSRYIGFTHGSLKGAFVLEDHDLKVSHAHIAADGTDIDLTGSIFFDAAKGLILHFDAPQLRLDTLGPFGPADCSGTGHAHGTVSGPYVTLDIDGALAVHRLRVLGFDVGDVAAHTHLNLDSDVLDVTGARGTLGQSAFAADGQLRFAGPLVLEARLSLDGARAIDLIDVARSRYPALAKLDGNVDAALTGDVQLSGPVKALYGETRLTLADAEAYGQKFDGGTLRARMVDGSRLEVESLELTRGEGLVAAHGGLTFSDESFNAELVTRKLTVSQIDALGSRFTGSTGAFSLRLAGDGTIDHPLVHGNLLIRDWRKGDQPLMTAQLDLALDGAAASVQGTLISPWPDDVERPLHTPGADWPRPPGSMLAKVHGTLELGDADPFNLVVDLAAPDAQVLAPPGLLNLYHLRGGIYATLNARGTLDDLSQTDGQLEISRLWVRRNDVQFKTAHAAVFTLSKGRFALDSLALHGDSFDLDASGAREADGTLAFGAQGTMDLAVLAARKDAKDPTDRESDFDAAKGTLSLELQVNGTESEPNFVGTASINGVELRLAGLPLDLTDGTGTVTFSRGAAEIDNLTGRLNGAKVAVDGSLTLDSGYQPGAFHFTAHLDPFPFDWDDSSMIIAGTPELTRESADDRIQLRGGLQLVRYRFTRDVELEHFIVDALAYGRRPTAPNLLEGHSGEVLDLNLPVTLGDVRIDNNLLKASAQGEVTLTGTNKRYGLLGTVTVNDAKAYYRNAEFAISSGVMNFTDKTKIQPSFDVRADTQVRDYAVHVNATGTLQHPNIAFSSVPALPDADIITLLTIGVTSKDFSANSTAVEGVLLDAAYNASGIPDQMKRLIPKNDLIKDAALKITSGYNPITQQVEPYAAFETKVLGDDLKLLGETSLIGGGRGKKAELDWKLRSGVDLSGQWNDDPSAPSYGDFGGDIRYHWEAP